MQEVPDKLYFKIGEVAKLVGVKPYVLRYWETEFASIRPGKTESKHRLYRRRDVETLIEIRRLLHDERYTIEGAKRRLRGSKVAASKNYHVLELTEVANETADHAPSDEDAASSATVAERAAGADDQRQLDLPASDPRFRDALVELRRELEQLRDLL